VVTNNIRRTYKERGKKKKKKEKEKVKGERE
jgi:hypothetical protein